MGLDGLDGLVIDETPFGARICIPKRVVKNFSLKRGDRLRWLAVYQGMDADIPPREIRNRNILVIQVKRGGTRGTGGTG